MINFSLTLHKLFFMHEWEEHERRQYTTSDIMGCARVMKNYTLRCKTCGTLKRKKIKL